MKDLLIQIVKALVDDPEQVQVNEIEGTQTVVLELRVAKSDMGTYPLDLSDLKKGTYIYRLVDTYQKTLRSKRLVIITP